MNDTYLIATIATVQPGKFDEVLALFQETNPDLVASEPDWLGAEVSHDADSDTVLVLARWRSADSYRRFAASERFRAVMARFAPLLAGPPEVRVFKKRWEMGEIV
jgi:quinol monooxygenase YgiN